MIPTWVEKANRVIRWLLLHPKTMAAGAVGVFLLVALLLVSVCSPPQPTPDPGVSARGASVGALPVTQAPPKEVQAAAEDLCEGGHNPILCAKIAALENEVGRLTRVFVVDATTKGFPVKAPRRPAAKGPGAPQILRTAEVPAEVLLPAGSDRPVALYDGERLRLHLVGVGVRTGSGQGFLPATVTALAPGGQELGTDVIDVPLSTAKEAPTPPPGGSSIIGTGGGATERGWAAAGFYASRRLWKVPLLPARAGWAFSGFGGPGQGGAFVFLTFEHARE